MTKMLLEWVFTSMFLILVVLGLRAALGKRVSAGLRYGLWAVVLVRLLVPVQLFSSPLAGTWVHTGSSMAQNVYKVTEEGLEKGGVVDVQALGGQDGPGVSLTAFPGAPEPPSVPDAPEPPAAPDLTKAPGWLGWAWLAGAAAVVFVLLMSNLRFYWRLRRERVPLDGADRPLRVYVAAGLPSPCLFGVVCPAVYVTPEAAADPDMLRHVLAHEFTHYRHGDHLWSLLRCAALAAHWWNPLVWLAARLSQRDGELCCDEGALKRLGESERAGYGNTLLTLVTAKPRPRDLFRCATTMSGDKKSLKERVSRIACAPRRWLWAAVAAVLATALACVCAFGQAEPEEDGPEPESVPSPAVSQGVEPESETAPAQVRDDAEEFVRGNFEALRDRGIAFGLDGAVAVPDPPELDEWRIDSLTGPYWSGERYWELLGVRRRVELWNVVYSYHTATPEKAEKSMAAGGTRLTEDGWLTPINYGAEYLVYELGEDGSRTLLTTFGEVGGFVGSVGFRRSLRVKLAAGGVPGDMADAYFVEEHAEFPLGNRMPDLNRDGVPETVQLVGRPDLQRVEIWQGDRLLFSEEGFSAHAGWTSLFLCTLDGEDCLLRYRPTMYGGACVYSYELFTLENGRETAVRENSVEFDINFQPWIHENFDPELISAFMDEVNPLLAQGVQLLNTDAYLLDTFEREGRQYDSLWFMNTAEGDFARDPSKSLLENLLAYEEAMKGQWYAETPQVFPVDELGTDIRLTYRDKAVRFESSGWDYYFQPAEHVEPPVVDLDGDGREEVVVILVGGHGTGVVENYLYLFDADTLEQYDTAGLNRKILDQIESAGDGDSYSLSAPWMERISIPREEAVKYNEYAPEADALVLGDVIEYSLEGDGLHCRLGCDASGTAINYIGYLDIALRFTHQEGVRCVSARYAPYE